MKKFRVRFIHTRAYQLQCFVRRLGTFPYEHITERAGASQGNSLRMALP